MPSRPSGRQAIELPEPIAPFANYLPIRRDGDLLYVSGQVAIVGGIFPLQGRVGAELSFEQGRAAARQCGLNLLGQVVSVLGSLNAVVACLKVTVFVSSAPDFLEHHLVADGASEVLLEVLGEAGAHSRSAVGVARLPMDSPVEVEALLRVGS